MKLSVIIPSWNDAENLHRLLPKLASVHEVIVVEASRDGALSVFSSEVGIPDTGNLTGLTSQVLRHTANVKLLRCDLPSRGKQMNHGAAHATGDVLVFLHADTEMHDEHLKAIDLVMNDDAAIGGAFYRQFDERHPHLRWLEPVARFLTRNGGTLFGDQTVFVRRDVFRDLGGFAEIPLMEDVEFSRRLRAAGRVVILDPPIRTSPRHHLEHGAWRTTFRNALFLLLFKLGVSAEKLHAIYYARRRIATSAAAEIVPPQFRAQ